MKKEKSKKTSIEERIKLLSEKDQIYIEGYIDRALKELNSKRTA